MRGGTNGERRVRSVITILAALSLVSSLAAPSDAAYTRPGVTRMVSVTSDGSPGRYDPARSYSLHSPEISGNGRYVVYGARPLDDSASIPGNYRILLYDLKLGRSELASVSTTGQEGVTPPSSTENPPRPADVSADGRFVAFHSSAPNLVAGDTNVCSYGSVGGLGPCPDVFVRDRRKGTTVRVSAASDGTEANNASFRPSISSNGRYVIFESLASNLVADDTNGRGDVFVHDLATGETRRVSVASDGGQANNFGGQFIHFSTRSSISADGRYATFTSSADNLIPSDTNFSFDVFVHDLRSGNTEPVSIASDGTQADGDSDNSQISGNGRYVAFWSMATNLVPTTKSAGCSSVVATPGGLGRCANVFVHDRDTGRTRRVSVTSTGVEAEDHSGSGYLARPGVDISHSGRFVTFSSNADNLFPGDPGASNPLHGTPGELFFEHLHGYVYDTRTGSTDLVTIDVDGMPGSDGDSNGAQAAGPSISDSGRYIAFFSGAYDLVENDPRDPDDPLELGQEQQIYWRDRGPGLGVGGFAASGDLSVGNDGTFARTGSVGGLDPVTDLNGVLTHRGANLYGASLAYRLQYEDLFVRIQLEDMPYGHGTSIAGDPSILYGFSLIADGTRYQIRSQRFPSDSIEDLDPVQLSVGGASFGLFRCNDDTTVCTKLVDLKGGYGTTGVEVVVALPLSAIGLDAGGELGDLKAFTAFGSYEMGAVKTLDTMSLPN